MSILKRYPFHVLLFAVYPCLALLAANLGQVRPAVVWRPLAISVSLAALAWLLLSAALRSRRKAALIVTLGWLLFFSYGHLYQFLQTQPGIGQTLAHHSLLAPLFLLVLAFGCWRILAARGTLANPTELLNGIGLAMVLFAGVQIGWHYLSLQRLRAAPTANASGAVPVSAGAPDIYYIVLDSYSRADVLQEQFGFDNAPFLDALRNLGFYVADCARSNYEYTEYSLASALNMDFIQTFGSDYREKTGVDWLLLEKLIKDSRVRRELEAAGYRTISFATGFQWSELYDADLYLAPNDDTLVSAAISPFEALLLRSTLARVLTDTQPVKHLLGLDLGPVNFPYEYNVRMEWYAFDQLERMSSEPGPKFVLAHLMTTHDPILFDAQGSVLTDPAYFPPPGETLSSEYFIQGAVGEFQYANQRVLTVVEKILAESTRPVVIILQGDHGREQPRHAVLNAYYLPGAAGELYATITPVNTFRVVFNHVLGQANALLSDTSYRVGRDRADDFTVLPEPNPVCLNGTP